MRVDLVDKLTKRHLAKLLDKLDQIQTADIIKDAVKVEFYYLGQDIKEQVLCKGRDDEGLRE